MSMRIAATALIVMASPMSVPLKKNSPVTFIRLTETAQTLHDAAKHIDFAGPASADGDNSSTTSIIKEKVTCRSKFG